MLGLKSLKKSNKEDILIALSFTPGMFAAALNKMFNLKRKIILINLIIRSKGKLITTIRGKFYRYLLNSNNIVVTVNTKKLIVSYGEMLKIKTDNFYVLPDYYNSIEYEEKEFEESGGYVFSGGESSRDWHTLFKSAQMLPNIKFIIVARKKYFPSNLKIPLNVDVRFDIARHEFHELLANCTINVLAIKEDVPAGLIVLIRGALLCKPAIATSTSSINNYVIHETTGLSCEIFNAEDLTKQINLLYNDISLQKQYAEALKEHVMKNYSDSAYVRKVAKIIDNLSVKK
jgi:glycosyltransferase involved in cell wall biosynthesis